jgi:hypothetical protein
MKTSTGGFARAAALVALTAACLAGALSLRVLRVPTVEAQDLVWCGNSRCSSPTTCQYQPTTECSFPDARSCLWRRCAFLQQ